MQDLMKRFIENTRLENRGITIIKDESKEKFIWRIRPDV